MHAQGSDRSSHRTAARSAASAAADKSSDAKTRSATKKTSKAGKASTKKGRSKLEHARATVDAGGLVSARHQSSGASVQEVQQALHDRNYEVEVDGKFGVQTETAVRKFQADNKLKTDGLVGKKTLSALSESKPSAPSRHDIVDSFQIGPGPMYPGDAYVNQFCPAPKPPAQSPASKPPTRPQEVNVRQMDKAHFEMLEERAKQVHTGVARPGTDEGGVYNALDGLSPTELVELQAVYTDHYAGANMRGKIEDDFSGKEETRALLHLEGKHAEASALGLHEALYPSGEAYANNPRTMDYANSGDIKEILSHHSEAEIAEMSAAYEAEYGRPLDEDLARRMDDPKDSELARAQASGVKGQATAVKLHQALSGGTFGGADEAEIKEIMIGLSPKDAANVNQAYFDKYQQNLRSDLGEKLRGTDLDHALAAVDADPATAGAARIRDEIDNWVMRDAEAVESTLTGKSAQEISQLKAAYAREYGSSLEADLSDKFGGEEATRIQDLLADGKLNPVRDIYKATDGAGTDEALLLGTLTGKTKDEIATIRQDLLTKYGTDLDQLVEDELSGRDNFDAKMMLQGKPESMEEAVAQLEERYQFERGENDGVLSKVTDLFYEDGEILDINHRLVVEAYADAKDRAGPNAEISARDRHRLEQLLGFSTDDVETYTKAKDTVADAGSDAAAFTVAGLGTVLTGGTTAPFWATALTATGAGAAKIGFKRGIQGSAYGTQEIATDAGKEVISFAAGQATGRLSNLVAPAEGRIAALASEYGADFGFHLTKQAAEIGANSMISGAGGAILDSETYSGGVLHGLGNIARSSVQGLRADYIKAALEEGRDRALDRSAKRIFSFK